MAVGTPRLQNLSVEDVMHIVDALKNGEIDMVFNTPPGGRSTKPSHKEKERLVRRTSPDMAAYLTQRTVGSEIRTRLQEPLQQALSQNHDVCLLTHSMGCLVGYDVLWKFSRLSEYRRFRGKDVSLWLTLGNPLGDPGVRCNIYAYPGHPQVGAEVARWIRS